MAEHTPGPWEWRYDSDNDDHWLWGADGDAVALELTSWKPSRKKANQSLIAAAPELLAMCKGFMTFDWDTIFASAGGVPYSELYEWGEFVAALDILIAKAKGKGKAKWTET